MARKRSPNSTNDRQRIQFAFNADRDTPIGRVFKYLLKSDKLPSRKGKLKGLDAMAAFWRPFAYQEDEQLSDDEKKAIARESVEALTHHISLLRETFDLENSQSSSDFKEEIKATVTEAIQAAMASTPVSPSFSTHATAPSSHTHATTAGSSSSSSTEGVDFDEDALLGGLFEESDIAA
ncbi:MAG: hypothetical protein AAFV90_25415 [Cyanobacteria bacterium J06634_5]